MQSGCKLEELSLELASLVETVGIHTLWPEGNPDRAVIGTGSLLLPPQPGLFGCAGSLGCYFTLYYKAQP